MRLEIFAVPIDSITSLVILVFLSWRDLMNMNYVISDHPILFLKEREL